MKSKIITIVSILILLSSVICFAEDNYKKQPEEISAEVGISYVILDDIFAMQGCYKIEYKFHNHFSTFAKFLYIDYEYDDQFLEVGYGAGAGAGIKAYLYNGNYMKGLYLSSGINIYHLNWTTLKNNLHLDTGKNNAINYEFEIGGRIPFGETPLSISPFLNTGYFDSSTELNGLYGSTGLIFGLSF
ncbi:MAG: hypothetical protein ACFFG0_05540 [Candidatus Thorarchaeota archaeon]